VERPLAGVSRRKIQRSQEAVAEIRTNGQYVFWKDEARLNLYKSEYYQQVGKTKKSVEPDEVPTEVTTV